MQRIAAGATPQRPGELGAQRKHALRMRPDRAGAVAEFRDRGRRADRGVRRVGLAVGRLQHFRGGRRRRLLDPDGLDLGGERLQVLEDARRVRQLRPPFPFRRAGKRRARLHGLLLALGDHAEERAVAHHREHARHRAYLGVVDLIQRRAIARRAHHAAVHHAGQAQILHVHRRPGHLAGNIETRDRLADDSVQAGRLRPHRRGRLALEIERRHQLRIGDRPAVRRADHAVRDAERIRAHPEPRRGELDQHAAHLGRRHAQRRAGVLHRLRARGHALVRRAPGVARDNRDARERQVELFRRDLPQRREDALAELHLAGEHRRAAVGIDPDPGIEHPVAAEAAWQRPLLRRRRIEREGEHEPAQSLGETPPAEGSAHHVLPISAAARSTAPTMRLWVPQRQRLLASAWRTSASLGRGLRSSSAFAVMIMPLMQ